MAGERGSRSVIGGSEMRASQIALEAPLARVVIVDDSLFIRQLLQDILSPAGHEVVGEAEDGLQAPLVVRELRPDLVVLDLVMPGRSGMSALRHMLLVDPSLAVIVCSASLTEAKVIEALRIGAKGFIVKPLDCQQVLDAVRCALGCGSCDRGGLLTDLHDRGASGSGPERNRRRPPRSMTTTRSTVCTASAASLP